jgi:hypothetical protein
LIKRELDLILKSRENFLDITSQVDPDGRIQLVGIFSEVCVPSHKNSVVMLPAVMPLIQIEWAKEGKLMNLP